jgi:hypothetical protein
MSDTNDTESVIGVIIEIDGGLLLKSGFKFFLEIDNKLSYPTVIR